MLSLFLLLKFTAFSWPFGKPYTEQFKNIIYLGGWRMHVC